VHRDDLDFSLNGYPIRQEGSQGQTKTYFIGLKLAQFIYLKERGNNRVPLLLLDDIFDKLDAGRVARIIDYVSSNAFGQIFITDTNREHLDTILATTTNEYKLFHVSDGAIKEVTNHETPEY
jgi:DNA replication and repair protein RecF